ncbi:MAG: extracellular solute-binding protein [Clostridia bacterium]|nr:extracellular solute-binding protein [Clostridia bacterium]
MKKKLLSLLMAALMVFSVAPMAACGSSVDDISTDPKTINVKIYKAGYGTKYIEELKKQFEITFADQGYKIKIAAHDPFLMGSAVYRSIYSNSGIDVYFTSSTTAETGVNGEYGQVLLDLTDNVFNKPAIKFDGTEEDKTIKEKMLATGWEYEGASWEGKYYGLPYVYSTSGLVINQKQFKAILGADAEYPRTSDEMFEMVDEIQATYDTHFKAPFTFSLSGNNYLTGAAVPWMIQLMGRDTFLNYMAMTDAEGNWLRPERDASGKLIGGAFEVFDHPALADVATNIFRILDWNTHTKNAAGQGFEAAQAQIMRGEAVFYFCGDWMYNEEYGRFGQYTGDIDFTKTPVISTVGAKLFGEGTSYNLSAEKADDVLSTIVKYVDQNLAVEEIEQKAEQELSMDLATADVEAVCTARGVIRAGGGAMAHIANNISEDKKEVAEAFLRFCASEEAGALFAESAYTTSPWNTSALKDSDIKYIASVANVLSNRYNVETSYANKGYKLALGLGAGIFPGLGEVWSTNFYEWAGAGSPRGDGVKDGEVGVSKYDEEGKLIAEGNAIYRRAGEAMAKYLYDNAYNQVDKKGWRAPGDID